MGNAMEEWVYEDSCSLGARSSLDNLVEDSGWMVSHHLDYCVYHILTHTRAATPNLNDDDT